MQELVPDEPACRLPRGPRLGSRRAAPLRRGEIGCACTGKGAQALARNAARPGQELRQSLARLTVERPDRVHKLDEGDVLDLLADGSCAAFARAAALVVGQALEQADQVRA